MKRFLSLILAAVMLAACLASCAAPSAGVSANARIRITSSDAADAAAWLDERLGDKLTDRIVLGTDAAGYALDLSTLEDDGYFIRAFGGEDVLFAKTPVGLDRAVRKYAKTVEAGLAVSDETYHEGARIKKLTIAGRDVSEFTIFCEDEAKMISSANKLSKKLEEACGVAPAVSTEAPSGSAIVLKYVHDESLRNVGYRWNVTDGTLTIECSDAYKTLSSDRAVVRFLEKRLDWFGLSYGIEDLTASDGIAIAEGETGGESPTFDWSRAHGGQHVYYENLENDLGNPFGPDIHACHGLQNRKFGGSLSRTKPEWSGDQPCWLSEEFYDASYDDIAAYIQSRIDAGEVIGDENFSFIDVAAGDNSAWCQCRNCRKMFRDEGGTEAGAVVTWANRLSEELDEIYPGLIYGIFAYAGTNIPPKNVKPNEHISITYCFDASCSAHPLDGSRCNGGYPFNNSDRKHANSEMAAQLRTWCDISPNMVVWYYGLGNALMTMSFVHTVRDDLEFFHDIGVLGAYWESEDGGFDTGWVSDWLANELMWNIDMSDEEYDAFYDRVLRVLYGDGGQYIKDYITAQDMFYENQPCVTCWCWGFYISPSLPTEWWKKYYDDLFALTETARLYADSAKQQRRLDNLSVECIYKGSVSNYFAEFNEGDDERIAELSRRYSLINERMQKYGVDMTKFLAADLYGTSLSYDPDLEVTMWYGYLNSEPYVVPWWPDHPTSEMPERISGALAEWTQRASGEAGE